MNAVFHLFKKIIINYSKGITVDGSRSVFFQRFDMFTGPIALIPVKAIFRVKLMVFIHNPVPGHLGYDGGCSNGINILVTIYYRLLGDVQAGYLHIPINQYIISSPGQFIDSLTHGLKGSLEDILPVNNLIVHYPDCNSQGFFHDYII